MSLNSYKNGARRAHLQEIAINGDFGLGRENLAEILASAKVEANDGFTVCRVTGNRYWAAEGVMIHPRGLAAMVQEGIEAVEAAYGEKIFPDNLVLSSMGRNLVIGSWPTHWGGRRRVSPAGADQLLREYGRIRGWLCTVAAECPGIRRMLSKAISLRGRNSPRTVIDLAAMVARFPSPHALERKLWKVRERSDAIFAAYRGEKASWANIARAVMANAHAGKAAVMAVAMTVSGEVFTSYRAARQWLIDNHACSVADEVDGVEARREAEPRLTKPGIAVHRIVVPVITRAGHQVGVKFQWLVRTAEGRTHISDWGGPVEAFHLALREWKEIDENRFFLWGGEGVTPLISTPPHKRGLSGYIENYPYWLERLGLPTQPGFIPAELLVPHLGDYHVNFHVQQLRKHLAEQRDAA